MKNIICIATALLGFFAQLQANTNPCPPAEPVCPALAPNKTVVLPAGTLVIFETNEDLFSTRVTVGQDVLMRVRTDVYADNEMVIATGAQALGRVKRIEEGSNNYPASITIELFYVLAVDMKQVPLHGNERTLIGDDSNTGSNAPVMSTMTANVMNNIKIKVD